MAERDHAKDTYAVNCRTEFAASVHNHAHGSKTRRDRCIFASLFLLGLLLLWHSHSVYRHAPYKQSKLESTAISSLPLKKTPAHLHRFQDCSIRTLRQDTDLSFLASATPPTTSEFISRRDRLAQALSDAGLDAYAVEPGYTFSYYNNVTQAQWEVWEPEERPFIMIVRPQETSAGRIVANTSFLVPAFEAERARLLKMPFSEDLDLVTYEEHWNPYDTLRSSRVFEGSIVSRPKVMVDEEMRDFISRGLAEHGFDVQGLGGAVERVRQIKTAVEVGILRAVNTGTVEAVRAVRKCLLPGLSESEVAMVLDNTLRSAGLEPFFDIVLFDENAANPHGGTDGTKRLEAETMILIDVGAHLYGYSSDICRSFFPPFLQRPETEYEAVIFGHVVTEKIHVWNVVFEAQTASLRAMHENASCASVDRAARNVIEDAGYGASFTHRVGHGIGIKAHESPYLNKANNATLLGAGMTFTSEPGIYLVDRFGARHEDVLLVREESAPDILSGRRAISPWEP